MNLEPFETEDGYRVWLDQSEVTQLLSRCEGQKEELAITLGVRSGLRASEIVAVEAQHVVETSAGPRVRVYNSKGKQYRETPTTESVRSTAATYAELRGADARLVPHSKRWVQRHLDRITDTLAAEGDVLVLDCEGAEKDILPVDGFDHVVVETHPEHGSPLATISDALGTHEVVGDDPIDGQVVVS